MDLLNLESHVLLLERAKSLFSVSFPGTTNIYMLEFLI